MSWRRPNRRSTTSSDSPSRLARPRPGRPGCRDRGTCRNASRYRALQRRHPGCATPGCSRRWARRGRPAPSAATGEGAGTVARRGRPLRPRSGCGRSPATRRAPARRRWRWRSAVAVMPSPSDAAAGDSNVAGGRRRPRGRPRGDRRRAHPRSGTRRGSAAARLALVAVCGGEDVDQAAVGIAARAVRPPAGPRTWPRTAPRRTGRMPAGPLRPPGTGRRSSPRRGRGCGPCPGSARARGARPGGTPRR